MDVTFGRTPFEFSNYDYELTGEGGGGKPVPYLPEQIAIMIQNRNLSGLRTAIARLKAYNSDMWAWYESVISTLSSSGGIERRNAERGAFQTQINAMIDTARAAVEELSASAVAESSGSLNNYGVPADSKSTFSLPPSSPKAPAPTSSLLLPIGAAIAAFLYLKGH